MYVFPNEIKAIKNLGGKIIWVTRGGLPEWYNDALKSSTRIKSKYK